MTLAMATSNAMMNGLARSVDMMQDDQLQTPDEQIPPTFFCRALYDYQSQDSSSLSFCRGEIIEVLTQMKSGWWDGMLGDERGWFPSNYVQPITDDEAEAELSRQEHGRPTNVHDSAIDVSQQYRTTNSEQDHDWLDDEEFGSSRQVVGDLGRRTGSNAGAASDFWVPQVTDSGQVYYLNTHTGERAREIPSGPGELASDSDLAEFSPPSRATSRAGRAGSSAGMNAPPSRSGSVLAGFGVARRGGTPEPWTKRLADDGLTHYYVNKVNGQVSWTLPTSTTGQSSYGSEPRQEPTRSQGPPSTVSGYGSQYGHTLDSIAPSRMRSDSVASHQQSSAKRLSVYSDDSDIQPQDVEAPPRPTRARKMNGTAQTVNRELKDEFNLTAGERNALQLQQRLAPPEPESIDHLSDITREAIIVVMAAVDDNGLPKGTDHDKQVEQHVTSVVVAVRNLLYISCALSSALPPNVGDRAVGDPSATAVAQQLQAQLKTSQRKVTATLSKLVLSARAARYKREAFSSDMMIRVEQDAADLQRAVDNFVAEVKKQYARTAIKQLHARIGRKRLRGTFAVSYVGLGLPGAGAAATWKGLGFVNVNDGLGLPKRNLDGEALAETRTFLGNLEDKFNQLSDLLNDPGSTADEVLGLSQELLAHLSSTLTFVSDLSVAQDIDVEGGRSQPGSSSAEDAYLQIVSRARDALRKLEVVTQALYDDSASVFMIAQTIPFGWSSTITQERLRLVHKLDSLSDLLRTDARITLNSLEDIMDICVEQSASAGLFRESMALRMSRMSILDGDQRLSNFFGSLPSGPDEEEDVVDMEIAFRKPGVRPVMDGFAVENPQSLASEPEPEMNGLGHFRNDSQHSETLVGDSETTLRRSEDDDLNGDPIIEKAPPRAAKIRQLLGPDVPERIFDNNDSKPWYLRSDNRDDLIINPDGGIRAGTLPALVERLTSHEYGDPVFIRTFLMTYKSFTTLDELLDLLIERYRMKPPEGLSPPELEEWSKLKQHVVRSRVLNTHKTMVTDDEVLEKDEIYILDRMKKFLLEPDVAVAPAAKNLLAAVERKKQGGSKSFTATPSTSFPPPSIIPKGMNKNKMKLLEIDPLELARQLTLLESTLYKRIRPHECLQRARESKTGENKDHITDVIQLTNKIANWVNSSILSKEDSRKRAALVKHFITMADRCRSLQNYSSMAAIVSGLNSTPIRRLKRTWDQVSGRFLSQLETCESTLDAARNFTNYKNALASVNPPCIPFMGVYLTTLTFIQEGSKDKLPGNLINFGKRQRAAEVIREIQHWQSKDYNLAPLTPVLAYIEDALNSFGDNVKWEDQFYNLSLEREPREREDEKMARLLQESGFL